MLRAIGYQRKGFAAQIPQFSQFLIFFVNSSFSAYCHHLSFVGVFYNLKNEGRKKEGITQYQNYNLKSKACRVVSARMVMPLVILLKNTLQKYSFEVESEN